MSDRIPKLVAGVADVDLRALPLAPIDGFVLSRIDGILSVRDIAGTTGMAEAAVLASLEKLEALGIVAMAGSSKPVPSSPPPPKASSSKPASARKLKASTVHISVTPRRISSGIPPLRPTPRPNATRVTPPTPSVGPEDESVSDEDVDMPLDQRVRVLELYQRLDNVDYYALLGVSRTADKKAIKRSYFEMASIFHPDKFFRKRLGRFKPKMEAIFGRITEAHDTLTSKEYRPEYDTYLKAQEQARGIETMMETANDEVQRVEAELQRKVMESVPPPPSTLASPHPPSQPPPRRPSMPPADPQALRDALARRLMGRAAPARAAATAAKSPASAYANSQEAVESLRRRYEDRLSDAHKAQAKKYADAAVASRAKNDMVAAANSFRVALGFAPNDAELKTAFEEARRAADSLLAESYLKQALYEERFEHWREAAKSWSRVARARPEDGRAHERNANALLKSAGNLHEAADSAKRAVALEAKNVEFKVTLANVYLAAGLALNAKRELESAGQLDPKHAGVQSMLKRLAKTG